jgi:2-methylcitrate dehydratase PrpD
MNSTEKLSKCIVETNYDSLPKDVIEIAKNIILDGSAVALAGTFEKSPKIAANHVLEMGGNPTSSLIGFGFKTSPVQAAYVNGISIHVLDFEAMWQPPTHATSPTLPVALALAEWLNLNGKEVIEGLIMGFEVQGRIRLATAHLKPDDLKLHPPGTVGVMGAAATAAKILQLDVTKTRHALGIAASRTGAVMANVGTMTKSNHCGNAARLGLEAALLARDGYTANLNVFEARLGYAESVFDGEFDLDALTAEFGNPYRMKEPGMAFKLFPSQYGTHFGINAALDLARKEDIAPQDIQKVHIITPPMRYVDRPFPDTGLEGKFSFQYSVSAALLDKKVNIDTFTDERRFAPDMKEMLEKVTIEQRKDISKRLEEMHVTVRVTLENGQVLENTCYKPRGAWGKPIEEVDLIEKARYCLNRVLDKEDGETIIRLGRNFENLTVEEVKDFMSILRAEK